jgi:hypothetical protein
MSLSTILLLFEKATNEMRRRAFKTMEPQDMALLVRMSKLKADIELREEQIKLAAAK